MTTTNHATYADKGLCLQLARGVQDAGGRALRVGGAVRDKLLGVDPKDQDIEILGVSADEVEPLLRRTFPHVIRVGRSFPVWKAWSDEMGQENAIDIALPRREVKTGEKHTDFAFISDSSMTFEEASARRDFTINAIGCDLLTGEYLDPHGGKTDLARRTLRHVSPQFAEDPLRVLRGAQFCARFDLTAAPETIAFCRGLSAEALSSERIMGEWSKLILKGVKPSAGLDFLRETNWIRFFPELAALVGVQQDPSHHPEGDVWDHTRHCIDAFPSTRTGVESDDLVAGFAVLCHDFGKATHTQCVGGRWNAHGHEEAGEIPTRSFLARMTTSTEMIDDVVRLVTRHMTPKGLLALSTRGQNMDRSVRRLSTHVRLDQLARVCYCDDAGRPPKPQVSPVAEWLREAATRLSVTSTKPVALLLGRDLLAVGEAAGPHWGPILKSIYSQQIDGIICTKEEALAVALAELRSVKREAPIASVNVWGIEAAGGATSADGGAQLLSFSSSKAVAESFVPYAPEPRVERSEQFSVDGIYLVTLGTSTCRIYRDPESRNWFDADSGALLSTSTRREALDKIVVDRGLPKGGKAQPFALQGRLIEFPAEEVFCRANFDAEAQRLGPGEILLARSVKNAGPWPSTERDPELRCSDASDVYATISPEVVHAGHQAVRGSAVKSATVTTADDIHDLQASLTAAQRRIDGPSMD